MLQKREPSIEIPKTTFTPTPKLPPVAQSTNSPTSQSKSPTNDVDRSILRSRGLRKVRYDPEESQAILFEKRTELRHLVYSSLERRNRLVEEKRI